MNLQNIDLFTTPEAQPEAVRIIIKNFESKADTDAYENCKILVEELNEIGFTCEYGLDGVPFNLQSIEDFQILASDITEEEIQEFSTDKICCPSCGSTSFTIVESLIWNAVTDDEGEVNAFNKGNEIDSVTCKKCDADLTEQFEDITINFQ